MVHALRMVLSLSAAALLSACSSTSLLKQPPEWGYEKDAIQLHLTTDPQLNLFKKQAHSLTVCLYHLRDPNGFNQLVDERDGLVKLLDCSRFDPSVTYAKRLVVQPNQEVTELLDRTEGAKFVGVVAGYYALRKEGSVRSYAIPVTELKKGSLVLLKPAKVDLYLYLGPGEITSSSNLEQHATEIPWRHDYRKGEGGTPNAAPNLPLPARPGLEPLVVGR